MTVANFYVSHYSHQFITTDKKAFTYFKPVAKIRKEHE